jgi:hypothetical protein
VSGPGDSHLVAWEADGRAQHGRLCHG